MGCINNPLRKAIKIMIKKRVVKYKIYWHKCIPFVIAEVFNSEWESIVQLIKEKNIKLKIITELYNSNGNWYILEGLDYFLFRFKIFTNTRKEILFSDSLQLWARGLSDKERWEKLEACGRSDIDRMWGIKK